MNEDGFTIVELLIATAMTTAVIAAVLATIDPLQRMTHIYFLTTSNLTGMDRFQLHATPNARSAS